MGDIFITVTPEDRRRQRLQRLLGAWEMINAALVCFNLGWGVWAMTWPPLWARLPMFISCAAYLMWRAWLASRRHEMARTEHLRMQKRVSDSIERTKGRFQ